MKNLILFICGLFALNVINAQSVVPLRADTVKIYKSGGSAELVLQNKTKDTLGFLKNMGNGRTEFHTINSSGISANFAPPLYVDGDSVRIHPDTVHLIQASPGVVMVRSDPSGNTINSYGLKTSVTNSVDVNSDSSRSINSLLTGVNSVALSGANFSLSGDTSATLTNWLYGFSPTGRRQYNNFLTLPLADPHKRGLMDSTDKQNLDFQQVVVNDMTYPTLDSFLYASPGLDSLIAKRIEITGAGVTNNSNGHKLSWAISAGFTNPMTAAGQLIYGGSSGTATATATPGHAGMKPIWNGTAVVWVDTTAGGSGGSQTFSQVLATGRTLANKDSILMAANQLYFKGGRTLHDSIYINTSAIAVLDTIYYIGDSYTNSFGAFSTANGFPTVSANKLSAIPKIRGTNGEVMMNRSPVNPFGTAYNGIQDTASVSAYNSLSRYLVICLGTNDAAYSNTNYTTANFIADYTTYMNHVTIRKGWPASKVLLIGTGYEGTAQLKQDSVIYSLPVAPTQARFDSFDSCVNVIATTFGTKYLSIRKQWKAFANNMPALLQAADSIHPSDQGHRFIADLIVNALGYNITKSNQILTGNGGLTEVDSLKVRILNPITGTNFSPAVFDSAGNLRAGNNMFLINNPVAPQPFIGYTSQGIYSHFLAPDFIRITGNNNIATTPAGIGGVMAGGGLELQHVSNAGYLGAYNRTTAAGEPLILGFLSTYTSIGSNTQYNSALLTVPGIMDVSGALWLGSTSSTTGLRISPNSNDTYFDQEAAGAIKFRTNSVGYNALNLLTNGVQFPGITSPISLDTSTYKLAVLDNIGNLKQMYWQVPSGGGYTLPTASTSVLGGVKVDGTSITISGGVISATPSGGGTGSPGGSNQNLQIKSGSSFYGAANLNYDTTNLWTLIGSSPIVATSTGAAAAGDVILKAGNRLLSSAASSTNTGSLGYTTGGNWEFRNYFTTGQYLFYTTGGGSTGTQDLSFDIGANGVISTGNTGNPGYGTGISGDMFMKYGGRILSGSASDQYSSISPNHSGIMEFKDTYSAGTIDFYTSKGTAGAANKVFQILNSGQLKAASYGSLTNTGTVASYAAFDASGNLIESTGTGGGLSGLTTNQMMYATSSTAIGGSTNFVVDDANKVFKVTHFGGLGSAPTSGTLGTNVTSITVTKTDAGFKMVMVTSGAVNGTLGVITFANAYAVAPVCVISSADAGTGGAIASTTGGYIALGAGTSTATFTGNITAAGTYTFNVITMQ